MDVCSNSHPPTLTLLVTVDPTKALRTATIVASKQVLEMRRQGMLLVHRVAHGATLMVAGTYSGTQCYTDGCWYMQWHTVLH